MTGADSDKQSRVGLRIMAAIAPTPPPKGTVWNTAPQSKSVVSQRSMILFHFQRMTGAIPGLAARAQVCQKMTLQQPPNHPHRHETLRSPAQHRFRPDLPPPQPRGLHPEELPRASGTASENRYPLSYSGQ